MLLRFTLWAMLLGSIIMGYFGYQTGSTLTTFVGMAAIVFILFLLFFLAKMTLTAGLTFVKVVVIILLIGSVILLCVRGCTIVWQKGQNAVHATTNAFQSVQEQSLSIPGKLETTSSSWWNKLKSVFDLSTSPSTQMLQPSKISTDKKQDDINAANTQVITGTVSKVLSSTTFVMNGIILKLYAIDAPDMSQTCLTKRSETYQCGRQAKKKLERLLLHKHISCQLLFPFNLSKN